MRRYALALGVLASGSVLTHAAEDGNPLRDALGRELARLESPQPIERQEAARVIAESRKVLIGRLVVLAESPYEEGTFFSSKELVINLLGEHRAVEVLDVLLSNLLFRPQALARDWNEGERSHPAVRALLEIGRPCELAVVRALERAQDEPSRLLLRFVLDTLKDGEARDAIGRTAIMPSQPAASVSGEFPAEPRSNPPAVAEPGAPGRTAEHAAKTVDDSVTNDVAPFRGVLHPDTQAPPAAGRPWLYGIVGVAAGLALGTAGMSLLLRRRSGG